MGRIAMAQVEMGGRSGVVIVALLFALAGVVGGASGVSDVADAGVPMLTLDQKLTHRSGSGEHREHRERRLATATVWCVAKSNLTDAMLQGALDWTCGPLPSQGQVNCFPVQDGQNCFQPDSVQSHASWAFNVYFQNHNATNDACDFQGTATQVYTDPSTSTCVFTGSTKEINGTISNGTMTPSPTGPGINYPGNGNAAAPASFESHFLFHMLSAPAVVMLMTQLLT